MDSDDEIVFSELVQRKRTNLVLSDFEEEVSEIVVLTGSNTADVNLPSTSTVIDSTQQQHSQASSQVVLVSATTTPKSNKGGKKQRKKRRLTDADNAYSMNLSTFFFFTFVAHLNTTLYIIIYILDAHFSYAITNLAFLF